MNTLEILENYVTSKRDETKRQDWKNKAEIKFGKHYSHHASMQDIGPFNEEDAFRFRELGGTENHFSGAKAIDKRLYNKRFTIGDFEITVTYKKEFKLGSKYGNDFDFNSGGYKDVSGNHDFSYGVYLNYHGHYQTLLTAYDSYHIYAAYCKPTQTNWNWLKPTEEKPYIPREIYIRGDFNKLSFVDDLMRSLDIDSLELKEARIQPQYQYNFTLNDEIRDVVKTPGEFTNEEIDVEWFVKQEIKDGVYRPEGSTISKWIFEGWRNKDVYDKNLLKKLGVHTIQLRAEAHFDPSYYFNMKGILIKAPKSVIKRYSLEKYCKNKDIVKKIKEEEAKAELERKAIELNSKFTLMQHGKVIKKNKDYYDIIEYLENFTPSSKMPKEGKAPAKTSVDKEILKSIQPIFDEFEDLNEIYLAYWGTYRKYEMRGSKCEFDYECDRLNEDIDKETYEQIMELHEGALYKAFDERAIVKFFGGWPTDGIYAVGVRRDGDSLVLFSEDYDCE